MARAYTTKRRPYDAIKYEVGRAREIADLRDTIDFSLTDYISGPLKDYFRGRLKISIVRENYMTAEAKVDLTSKNDAINLFVKERVWSGSKEKIGEDRFVLGHEIGHIWLHRDDEFSFSESIYIEFIEPEYFVEEQANVFGDIFLLTDGAVRQFDRITDLRDYCDYVCEVPISTIERRFAAVSRSISHHFGPRYDTDRICNKCGGSKVAALFNFMKCDDCGNIRY